MARPTHAALPENGTYVFSGSPAEKKHRLAAIDAAANAVFFAARGAARRRLRAEIPIIPIVTLERRGDVLRIGYEDRFYEATLDAPPVRVVTPSGKKLRLRAREEPGALVVEFTSSQGGRMETYMRDRQGVLVVDVHVWGKRLPKPVQFRLTYHKTS